jgi:D-alanyl-D-alanine carboxypeptidase
MIEAAQADGVSLQVVAGYRSYSRQASAYTAGTTDVPAGASEHNLGLSVDIMTPSETSYNISAFEATAAYQWLRDNAANYGFILRYPEDATAITGFNYEPWHYRYVGVDQAQKIVASGLTLEQYLAQDIPTGIPG